ncbi:GNAT family N-acetyltransferase [Blastococcus atacamensis]|uniref:GNAT family N-acetyltransferase n=1 Tax=Blastococcus atacamensis TaxID=2070508 RepID=UPI000CEC2B0F|nr:GNAT family N-acetyltransferase [Blastococcus atacamensis]
MASLYAVRPVRASEWREIRALRLAALTDEVAATAFVESYDAAAGRPDEFWQERAQAASVDAGPEAVARQFIAVADDGTWVGTAVALVEKAGEADFEGAVVEESGGHLVGVYLHPGHRGAGVMDELFEAALEWLRELGLSRVRLYVHADNARAQRFYEKAGFRDTGGRFTGSIGPEIEMAKAL